MKRRYSLASFEIQKVLNSKHKLQYKNLILCYRKNPEENYKYAIVISRQIKKKPIRNLIKRQLRSLMMMYFHQNPKPPIFFGCYY